MPGQHSNDTKEQRSRAAIAIGEQMNRAYREALIGTEQEVLFEEMSGPYYTGHALNYERVYAEGENLHNQVRKVRISGLYGEGLLGEIL